MPSWRCGSSPRARSACRPWSRRRRVPRRDRTGSRKLTDALDAIPRDAFAGRRCLVTGGLGFIGSNLALALLRHGAEVTVLDARVPRHGANTRNLVPDDGTDVEPAIVVVEGNLLEVDRSDVRDAATTADVVFNLAGQVSHVDSMADPLFDLESNTTSQFAFLDLLRRENAGARVVFTSTRQLFGKPRYLPVDEDHPVDPVDVNGITKYATEQLHLLYHEVYGLPASRGPAHQRVRPSPASARRLPGVPADLHPARARRRDDHRVRRRPPGARLPLRRRRRRVPVAGRARAGSAGTAVQRRERRAPRAAHDRRGDRGGGGLGPGRARRLADRSRRDRHRLLLRRLVEGEAHARVGAATSFADGIEQTVAFYRSRRSWYE